MFCIFPCSCGFRNFLKIMLTKKENVNELILSQTYTFLIFPFFWNYICDLSYYFFKKLKKLVAELSFSSEKKKKNQFSLLTGFFVMYKRLMSQCVS